MKVLPVEAITNADYPKGHEINLLVVREMSSKDKARSIAYDAFSYGRIIGIQEERARNSRKTFEIPVLIDTANGRSVINYLIRTIAELETTEIQSFADEAIQYITQNTSTGKESRVNECIREVAKVELMNRRKKGE